MINYPDVRRIARATLVALCLSLLPSLALAQTSDDDDAAAAKAAAKKKTKKATKPAEAAKPAAPAEKPAPAAPKPAPVAEKPAAQFRDDLPPPRRAHRAAAEPSNPLLGKLEVEGALGLAIPFNSGLNTGFKLEGGAFYGLKDLSPTMLLQLGGKIGFTYNGVPSPLDGSSLTFDFVPIARLRFAINEKLYAFADGGAGLAIVRTKINIPFFGTAQTDTSAGFLLKLGGGVGFDLNDKISLVGEPALNIYLRSGSFTELTLMVGAVMKL